MKKIAILGAGTGGCAAAVDLTLRGHQVNIHCRWASDIEPIEQRGGIEATIAIPGEERQVTVKPNISTTDLEAAVTGVDLIMIITPATAHEYYAKELAPFLREGQAVFIVPGHVLGGLHFVSTLRKMGFDRPIVTGETRTLPYSARRFPPALEPGKVRINDRNKYVGFAAFPGKFTAKLAGELGELFPGVQCFGSVLEVGLSICQGVVNTTPVLINACWIEQTKGLFYYWKFYEDASVSMDRVMQAVDKERMDIMRACGLKPVSAHETFYRNGFTTEAAPSSRSLSQILKSSVLVDRAWVPSLDSRYIEEDVPFILVPMVEIGRFVGAQAPMMEALIRLASVIKETDYYKVGRTIDKMGLAGIGKNELDKILQDGF